MHRPSPPRRLMHIRFAWPTPHRRLMEMRFAWPTPGTPDGDMLRSRHPGVSANMARTCESSVVPCPAPVQAVLARNLGRAGQETVMRT